MATQGGRGRTRTEAKAEGSRVVSGRVKVATGLGGLGGLLGLLVPGG